MKRVLRMTGLLVLCVGFAILAQGISSPRQQFKMVPDLVVLEVTYRDTDTGDFRGWHTYSFGIGIKNNGSAAANVWTKAAVYIVSNGPSPYLFRAADVSPIAAGDALMVFVTQPAPAPPAPCCVIVVVDAPITGKPLGQMNEGTKGEMNNGFVFFLSPSTDLQTFENPAFHP